MDYLLEKGGFDGGNRTFGRGQEPHVKLKVPKSRSQCVIEYAAVAPRTYAVKLYLNRVIASPKQAPQRWTSDPVLTFVSRLSRHLTNVRTEGSLEL